MVFSWQSGTDLLKLVVWMKEMKTIYAKYLIRIESERGDEMEEKQVKDMIFCSQRFVNAATGLLFVSKRRLEMREWYAEYAARGGGEKNGE
ncbi:MAG: hypothetical protein DRJ03_02645 [Chloroflexi bacterium]|nr:MAG: hypothetical protein DRJ03_02645 [Chloroflexota bacterium]